MNMPPRIYLSPPHMNGSEIEAVREAFDSNWIAPLGPSVDAFEACMAKYLGCAYGVSLNSGTSAIHLALKILGTQPGDYVFCSDVTFAASCNPILYEKAVPVFVDCDRESWNMSPAALERALADFAGAGKLPRAVIVVDLYGLPARYDEILPICARYGVPVIEDAAEALGSLYRGKRCGTFGAIGVLSFNANKILTCSSGGMILTDIPSATEKARYWSTHAREPVPYYEHREAGYNYRMSNILASVGLGQMSSLRSYIAKRVYIQRYYMEHLASYPVTFAPQIEGAAPNCWLTVMAIDRGCAICPDDIINALIQENIEARHFWNPMHRQPVYYQYEFYTDSPCAPVGEDLFNHAVCLPSGTAMTEAELERIIAAIRRCFDRAALLEDASNRIASAEAAVISMMSANE